MLVSLAANKPVLVFEDVLLLGMFFSIKESLSCSSAFCMAVSTSSDG